MTENVLQKVHVFESMGSYEQNKTSVGTDDIVLIPAPQIRTVQFSAGQWTGNTLRIAASSHGTSGGHFLFTLRHQVSGTLKTGTWATVETSVAYDASTGDVVLTASAPYDGAITFS